MRYWASVFAVLAGACLLLSVPRAFAVDSSEATAAVSDAEAALRGSFAAVSDAENVGADVSGLMLRMNEAGVMLTRARVALVAEDYDDALSKAGECKGLADGVLSEAGVLKDDAVVQASRWWVIVSLSVVSSAVFVVVLFAAWRRFRRLYADKLLGSRPEVVG